ncbi:phage tail protein, partial [Ralstonia pseudosolanacearum]
MPQTFFIVPTAAGEARDANAKALGQARKYTHIAVGDGGGVLPTPDRARTALVNECYRAQINALWQDQANPGQFIAELVIPETVGGWWVRELGLIDADGTLAYYGNCPETYKP